MPVRRAAPRKGGAGIVPRRVSSPRIRLEAFVTGRLVICVIVVLTPLGTMARAEPLSAKAVMTPKEQISVDLPTTPKHFVLFVRREGRATGTGLLAGAPCTE